MFRSTVQFPQSRVRAGVSRGDITPPIGIYHRMWGAATHDRATGIHRPLTATVLALAPSGTHESSPTIYWIAVDHCLLWRTEMDQLLDTVSRSARVDREQLVVLFSHTHGAGLMGLERRALPGGELIHDYLAQVGATIGRLVEESRDAMREAEIVYGTGHCGLASNRDFLDPTLDRHVCGYHPDGVTDDTLVVGRITSADGPPIGVIVNYACHPTTLAWRNTLISPDYPGAMRALVEDVTRVPTIFIQGASGDLGPRENYVDDCAVADQHGRQLGYAVLSVLEGLPRPGVAFEYRGPVLSGATLGVWDYAPITAERARETTHWSHREIPVSLPYRDDLPTLESLQSDARKWDEAERDALLANDGVRVCEARAMRERTTRRLTRYDNLPRGDAYPYVARLWRMGDAAWLALNGEHYNVLQRRLRASFPNLALVVGTLANGSNIWYLPDMDSYGKGLYQEEASVVARGGLESLIAAIENDLRNVDSR